MRARPVIAILGRSVLVWVALALVTPGRAAATPTVVLTVRPANGVAPLDVVFDGSASRDPNGIVSWRVRFGDGASTRGNGSPSSGIAHRYAVPGTFTATLRVYSADGSTAAASTTVVVRSPGSVSMFRYDAAHSGVSAQTVLGPGNVGNLKQRWRLVTGSWVFGSPILAGGVVYIGSADGKLYALDENTGQRRWAFDTQGGRVNHTPAVANGVVYAAANQLPYVWALRADTGQQIWRTTIGAVGSSPVVDGDRVYLATAANPGELVALRRSDGAVLWRYRLTGQGRSTPAVADGVVYVADLVGRLHAVRADSGQVVWTYLTNPNPCPDKNTYLYVCGGIYSSPTVANGLVYFGARDDNVYAIDVTTGRKVWSYTTQGHVESSPAVSAGTVYVGGNDSYVYAIDAGAGTLRWRAKTGKSIDSSPTYTNGMVVIGSNDSSVYAFDATTGAVRWPQPLGDMVMASPTVADGMVLVGDGRMPVHGAVQDTSVYAFSL